MPRNSRSWFTAIILFVLLSLISACAGASSDPAAQPATSAPAPTEEPAEAPDTDAAEPTTASDEPTSAPEPTMAPEPTAAPSADEPLYGGTLVVARWPDIATCNPGTSLGTDITVSGILGNIFDPLIRPNAAGEMQPQLATSWEVSEDGLMITWQLRDDVTWHDGTPFTSRDVQFTYEGPIRTLHPRGKVVYDALDYVETPDDYTAIFHMTEPRAAALFQSHGSEGLIIPAHIYENEDLAEGPHATCEELPVGTGPFRAVEYVPGERFVVERNPDWWGASGDYWGTGQPYLDQVIFTFIADTTASVNCLEAGECDYVGMLRFPTNEVSRFRELPGRDVLTQCTVQALGIMNFYGMNHRRAPLDDVRVRQAMSYALDRDQIIDRVYFGTASPTTTYVGPDSPWYTGDIDTYDYNLDRARELLDEAGLTPGDDGIRFEITMTHDTRSTHTDLANYFQQAVAEVGIKVNLEALDFPAWVEKVHMQQDFDMMSAVLGVGDPAVGAARIFISSNIDPAPFNNSAAYVNPEMDELWSEFATTFDFEERKAIMADIQGMISDDVPYIFVASSFYPLGVNTEEFAGFPTDCGRGDDLLRTIWWRDGRAEP
jgi:peptide/nickel transport system substrate-binding protein